MLKLLKNAPLPSVLILGTIGVLATGAVAADAVEIPHRGVDVTEHSESDPTSSTSQSLPSSGERLGCIIGYSDRTYRGDRALSRSEFAAALNACLNQVEQLGESNTSDRVIEDDLASLERQLEKLKSELERLRMQLGN